MSLNRENTGWSEDGTSSSTVILSYVAVGLCNLNVWVRAQPRNIDHVASFCAPDSGSPLTRLASVPPFLTSPPFLGWTSSPSITPKPYDRIASTAVASSIHRLAQHAAPYGSHRPQPRW